MSSTDTELLKTCPPLQYWKEDFTANMLSCIECLLQLSKLWIKVFSSVDHCSWLHLRQLNWLRCKYLMLSGLNKDLISTGASSTSYFCPFHYIVSDSWSVHRSLFEHRPPAALKAMSSTRSFLCPGFHLSGYIQSDPLKANPLSVGYSAETIISLSCMKVDLLYLWTIYLQ